MFFVPELEACLATTPPEEVYITSTQATSTEAIPPTDEPVKETTETATDATTQATTEAGPGCGMCDIDAIAPDLPDPLTSFDTLPRDPVDGCQQIFVQCGRDDALFCEPPVTVYAVNADGTHDVSEFSAQTGATSTLLCGDDGLYSFNGVMGITQLICTYNKCE
ncbi:hypothetical protein B9Z55_011037 [Caenorhabditis nigoni]|nr:hypothetical protein B9Z55_011037 [Caenorhabditis nigoni]